MNNEPHIGIDIYQRKGGQTFSDNKHWSMRYISSTASTLTNIIYKRESTLHIFYWSTFSQIVFIERSNRRKGSSKMDLVNNYIADYEFMCFYRELGLTT